MTDMLNFMQDMAREAGDMMVTARTEGLKSLGSHYKGGSELVTQADTSVENFLCERILSRFPDHRILAEESAPELHSQTDDGRPLWIIDPIDGTVNYAHGHFQSAVSIAWVDEAQIRCGVVYNPFVDEMFSAEKGQGAFLNGAPIQVGEKTDLRRCLVATGFPYVKKDMPLLIRRLAAVLDECADLRRLGSAALDICWVAAGRLDAFYENLSVWDFAAAQLIAIEAGAHYGHFQPVPEGQNPAFFADNILVANPTLFPVFERLLQDADRG